MLTLLSPNLRLSPLYMAESLPSAIDSSKGWANPNRTTETVSPFSGGEKLPWLYMKGWDVALSLVVSHGLI